MEALPQQTEFDLNQTETLDDMEVKPPTAKPRTVISNSSKASIISQQDQKYYVSPQSKEG